MQGIASRLTVRSALGLACAGPALALAVAPSVAWAQDQSSSARTVVLDPLGLERVRDLDFGYVLPNGTDGTVTMTPSDGSTEHSCVAANILHVETCQPAEFGGLGSSNQIVRVRVPSGRRIVLTGPGADILIDELVVVGDENIQRLSPAGSRRNIRYRIVSAEGAFVFRIGGRLNVAGNQAPGEYSATFDVELNYR